MPNDELNDFRKAANLFRQDGKTVAGIVINSHVAGLLAVSDPVKKDAGAVIRQLRHLGLKVTMLTGDHHDNAAFWHGWLASSIMRQGLHRSRNISS